MTIVTMDNVKDDKVALLTLNDEDDHDNSLSENEL